MMEFDLQQYSSVCHRPRVFRVKPLNRESTKERLLRAVYTLETSQRPGDWIQIVELHCSSESTAS